MILPGAQELFEKYLLPWHDGETKPTTLRPGTFFIKGIAGKPLIQRQHLRADYAGLLQDYLLETLPNAARYEYQRIISFTSFNETVLAAADAYYDAQKVVQLVDASNPSDFANDYLTAVSYFAAMLSSLFLQQPGFGWLYQHPYFHSVIVHYNSGKAIPVFDWAVKKFSSDGLTGNIISQYKQACNVLQQG